eukprot:gnl/TRDRNA2_/TRDRNA2_82269_c1_seq1.p1 gnl/TRDRNA2_/TRDRNA2_82269_c1~~gnl/TRDRNA2_/TRDRNA2_82269_c1_seq1.p1  ORF type:complete len:649 (+),score=127.45 gnl/TRDRNA2_/TRDRNA2_82269_c1_seq1:206-1948(+)
MRLDTIALFRDLNVQASWLVIDGADRFYRTTVHMHEGIQNPSYAPLEAHEIETFELTNIVNFLRLEQEHPLSEVDVLWIDDPQPLGMVPIIKSLYPEVLIVWRCHVHVDPEPSIKCFIQDLMKGILKPERDYALAEFIRLRGHKGGHSGADAYVFHQTAFANNLGLLAEDKPKIHIMPPCINPLSFKNMQLNDALVEATLVKYGIMTPRTGRDAKVPPIVLEVSRFDPYKGPLELIVAFTEAAKKMPLDLQKDIRLVMVSSLPGDNPSGVRLARLLQEFVDALDLSDFPEEQRAGGSNDLRKRIFLLMLDDKSPWERLIERLAKASKFDKDRIEGISREVRELASLPIPEAVASLEYCGLISPELASKLVAEPLPTGVTATPEQKAALLTVLQQTRARRHPGGTAVTRRRVEQDSLNGKELNAFEVNALQSSALVNVQFSSKEGFGLTVSEALVKSLPGYEGVAVVTLVGGIRPQAEVCECLTIEYLPEEAAASLQAYRSLPDHPDDVYFQKLFKDISARTSVRNLTDHLSRATTMPEPERVSMCRAARDGVLKHFSTWVNVHNILRGMALGARCGASTV